MTQEDQARAVSIARIRGGLHDLGLDLRSPQVLGWVQAALVKARLAYPVQIVSLPDEALTAMADAIERKVLAQAGMTQRREDTAA